jgi:hypothetical protein
MAVSPFSLPNQSQQLGNNDLRPPDEKTKRPDARLGGKKRPPRKSADPAPQCSQYNRQHCPPKHFKVLKRQCLL